MPIDAKTVTNYAQGNLKQTGNNFDFAIMGTGFFAVIATDDELRFIRNGRFTIGADRILKDMNSRNVSDADDGEIYIGETHKNFDVFKDSRIFVDGDEVGSIDIFRFAPNEV